MKKRPQTGEKRDVRQPLKIDQLPPLMHERIERERSRTTRPYPSWTVLETESPKWEEWEQVTPEVMALFPGKRLPHSNLARWWDLRVEQVRQEVLAKTASVRTFVESFAKRTFEDVDDAVINALRDMTFSLITAGGDPKSEKRFMSALNEFGYLVAKIKKVKLDQAKLELEKQKLDARSKGDDLDPREMYLQAAQDVLKKLRSRKQIKEAIDPVREELITEFAHAAETFAKQIEARSA